MTAPRRAASVSAIAVYTPLSDAELGAFAARFDLGPLAAARPIAAGSVNTNYRLDCARGAFFLRVNEGKRSEEVEYEAALVERLRDAGLATPGLLRDRAGARQVDHHGRPVTVFEWIEGRDLCGRGVRPDHVAQVGRALARLHLAARGLVARRLHPYGLDEVARRLGRIGAVEAGDPQLAAVGPRLRAVAAEVAAARAEGLPGGPIHGDLFRDNVLFRADRLVALLDFEQAGDGPWAYDLMVCLHAWCFGADRFEAALATALARAYATVRPLARAERDALFVEARVAALRFSVTRITDFHLRAAAGPRVEKDFRRYVRRLDALDALGAAGLAALLGLA